MKRLLIVAALALSGCATGYHSSGFSGGFEETALAPNIYRVGFAGNAYTSSSRAEELALLRSADLTLQKGYSYFALASSESATRLSAYTNPSTTSTMGSATVAGNSATWLEQSTTTGGGVEYLSKPNATNLVVMYKERPSIPGMVFDAQFLCGSIGPKYKAQCGAK